MKTRRVGSITLGMTLIGIGIIFLVSLIFPILPAVIIQIVWPVIFILLGIEVIWSNIRRENQDFVYDKTAILLVVILTFFAMFLAVISQNIRFIGF